MNTRATFKTLGALLLFLGVMLLTPIPFSLYYRDSAVMAFVISSVISLIAGASLFWGIRAPIRLSYREGFGIVTLGWLAFAVFGALPFLFSGTLGNPIDAYFESMSGFSTTGATVIANLDVVPESVLFWRATTHWIGGMGIIVLTLAILPFLGVGGMQLFQAEVPGPTADRLYPRIQDTAKVLWGVYFLLTLAETILLMVGGMSFYESVCHSFATLATGGFSTRNESIGAWNSPYIHLVVTTFMLFAGVNFSLHFYALRGRVGSYWKSHEFRFFVTVLLVAFIIIFIGNLARYDGVGNNAVDTIFQVLAITTTTGFTTADYELWPVLSQYILLFLMFLGGCAGSTGGGMKVVRILLIVKHAYHQLFHHIHPRGVRILKVDRKAVPDEVMQSILGFFALYMGLFVVGSFVMSLLGLDFVTAGASVVACLSNIGPGFGDVGPTDHYVRIPMVGKLILTWFMLLGRLEIFTVFVLFFPSFWRK